MKKLGVALVVLAVIVLIGWMALRNPATTQPARAAVPPAAVPPDDELASVPRIPLAQAARQIEDGTVIAIDVRDADSYVAGHLPGALQIPLARIEGEINYLPRDKPIIAYCT